MYLGFELKNLKNGSFNDSFKKYLQIGKKDFEEYKLEISGKIDEFTNANQSIDGNKMQSAWFPKIDADIFLSHSHADEDLVIAFAGWLKNVFNLRAFVDSCIWGYSGELQNLIDNQYNKIEDGKYYYEKVLYASSHVHMMLNTALMQMIDNCECIIFINTPNSVKPKDVIDKVVSPWIYSEIAMTKLIKKKSIYEHRIKDINESVKKYSEFQVEYNLETEHLIQLTINDLKNWQKSYKEETSKKTLETHIKRKFIFSGFSNESALDYLYKLKSNDLI